MRRDFAAAAGTYHDAAALAWEVGARMASRLDLVRIAPARFADIGCATGDGIRELQRRYGAGSGGGLPLAIDFAPPMLHEVRRRAGRWQRLIGRGPRLVAADAGALPLAAGSLGLVWSNLMLHWLPDPLPAFREFHRVLEVGGLLSFSALGPDTLQELRAAAAEVGTGVPCMPETALRAPTTGKDFIDMHDLGDMLVAAGFAEPVLDMERITLTYASARGFLAEQRRLGVRDALLGSRSWREWRRLFRAWPLERDGRLPATFEIVYGHAWKAPPRQTADGRTVMSFHRR